jgi:nitroreductase
MMNYFEVIKNRYSVRSYKSDPVEEDKINKILEAARMAPTAHNNQPFKVIVIHTEGRKEELQRIYHREWFTQAPLILCVCGVSSQSWLRSYDNRSYLDVDAAIVMDHMILAATALGLGTCWIAAFNVAEAREILQIPPNAEPLLFTPLGYPGSQIEIKTRKPISELVSFEKW